ncbi:MAG: TonB-dependent receptor [bacterium]|nr:TonB-dependent receptor [bacterium]
MIKKVLIVLLATMFMVTAGFAQTAQTGAIKGTVTDPDGVTLPGITVITKSSALVINQMTTVTNANGQYRFLGLPSGEYELTFMLEGMNTYVRKGIVVRVGRTATVDVGMTLKSLEESIVVSGKAPTVDRQKTTGVASLDVEFLKMVPSQNRSFTDYFNLTPGVTGDSAHGSGTMENSYNLDGVNVGDPATGLDFVSFGMDIMEEISVQTGGISAEYGSVKGAMVNVVTKSGGNNFSGSLYFYYDHESLQSTNTEGTDLYDPDAENQEKTGRKFQSEPGASLGGPLIKDKLWFFANFNMIKNETYAPGYPYNGTGGDIPADREEVFPYLKLTYQPTQSDKFIIGYNFSDLKRNHRGANRYQTTATTRLQETPTHVFNAHWTKTFGSNFYANLKLAYVKFDLNIDAKAPGAQYSDWLTSQQTGTYWRNKDRNQRDRYQAVFDATTFIDDLAGSHEVKFGGEFQQAKTGWNMETNTDDPTGMHLIYMYPEAVGGTGVYYGYHIETFDRKDDMRNFSMFLNDTWSVTNNLTLNLGIRYDYNSVVWPAQGGDTPPVFDPFLGVTIDRTIGSTMTPMKWNNISPRLGLIYDIFSDGTTLFKASWSHYVQPNQVGWINLAHPNGWHYWRELYLGSDTVQAYLSGTSPSGTQVGYGSHDLIAPTSNELTVGIEREMWEDWSLGIRYIRKWEKDLIHIVDANALDIDALLDNGELVWTNWEALNVTDPYDGGSVMFYNNLDVSRENDDHIVNPPGAERNYDGVELTLNKRYSHGWQINASYVYGDSRGLISTSRGGQSLGTSSLFDDPNAHVNAIGRFPLERRHQFKLTGMVKGPWGINLGGYFRYMSGRRWTRTVSSSFLGAGLNQTSVTNNAETRGNDGYPALRLLDLKVEKAFRFGKVEFKVFADIFNVFNENTILTEYVNSSNPSRTFGEDLTIAAPRVVRFGARIEF